MRLTALSPDDYTEAQREAVAEATAGVRGRIPGPMRAWIHSPTLATRAQQLGAFVRYGTSLPAAASELAILLVARHAKSSYVWNAHAPEALKAGLPQSCIDAIAGGTAADFPTTLLQTVCDYTLTLLETQRVPATLHTQAVASLGEAGTVELVSVIGYYSFVAMTVNAFAFELPPGTAAMFGPPD